MTAAFRVSGDRPPPRTSAMRPFSMVMLAPGIGVGSTQSMRVALVRTVRGTREAYRIRRARRDAAYGVLQTTFPSAPRSTSENTGSFLTTSAPAWPLLVSVVPQDAKGEIGEVPEQGESAQGREDAHDIGHVLHLVPETVAGHGCLPGGPHRTAPGQWVQTPQPTRPA